MDEEDQEMAQDSKNHWCRIEMAMITNICVPVDTKSDGCEYGSEFVPADTGADTTLNPTDIF